MPVHHRHFRTTVAAIAAGLLVLVSGCSEGTGPADATMGDPATGSASPSQDPQAATPTVNACYRMTYAQTQASDPQQVREECSAHLANGLGLSRKELASSVLDWVWFEPTTDQWSAGARWFRCDAIAESEGRLERLPAGTPPIFTDGVPDAFFRCVDDRNARGRYVTCDQPHDYRWVGSFRAKGGPAYPTRKAFEKQGRNCYRFTDDGAYWVTWPLEPGWDSGEREMNCYKQVAG